MQQDDPLGKDQIEQLEDFAVTTVERLSRLERAWADVRVEPGLHRGGHCGRPSDRSLSSRAKVSALPQ